MLAAADGELSLFDAREGVLYRGPATAENLGRLLPLPISPADLAEILCGSAPLIGGRATRAEPGRGSVKLELVDGERTQKLRIGPAAKVERSSLLVGGARGEGTYDLAFDLFESSGPTRFPNEVSLSAESPPVRLDLSWSDVATNATIDPALFRPPTPRGARVVELADAPTPAGLFPEDPGR